MKLFAVTVKVEADDTIGALEAAGDLFANMEAVHQLAALENGVVAVRPARALERATEGG